ncbi:MAG: zinc ribbon domain-containing protein, partial [Deltaproteobacteria bacterium]|nr:zinc ribbon domain-containing protein [Deltaproteobacteria bacterium]
MYCRHCGKELRPGLRFCGNCGVPIVDPASAAPGHDESKQKGPPRPVDPMIGRNLLGQFVIKQ